MVKSKVIVVVAPKTLESVHLSELACQIRTEASKIYDGWLKMSELAAQAQAIFVAVKKPKDYEKWAKAEFGWTKLYATRLPLAFDAFKNILADHRNLVDINCLVHLVRQRYQPRGELSANEVKKRIEGLRKSYIQRINKGVRVTYETFRFEIYKTIGSPSANPSVTWDIVGVPGLKIVDKSGKMQSKTIMRHLSQVVAISKKIPKA